MLSSMAVGYITASIIFAVASYFAHWRRIANEASRAGASGGRLRREATGEFLRANRDTAAFAGAATLALSLVVGIYDASSSGETPVLAPALAQDRSDPDFAALQAYAGTVSDMSSQGASSDRSSLPGVETMIMRLKARLDADPQNGDGWRMLGWSYFNTGRYADAVSAYARAVALDPTSTELKAAYEEAKGKAAATVDESGAPSSTGTEVSGGEAAKTEVQTAGAGDAKSAAAGTLSADQQAMIHSMVDRLAARLDASPHDVEGWIRLLRSRMVLGERDLALKALRRALDEFVSEPETRARISQAANELGLAEK